MHWQSDVLTTRLDLIRSRLDLIRSHDMNLTRNLVDFWLEFEEMLSLEK
jgi:hypothetical protein